MPPLPTHKPHGPVSELELGSGGATPSQLNISSATIERAAFAVNFARSPRGFGDSSSHRLFHVAEQCHGRGGGGAKCSELPTRGTQYTPHTET